MEAAPPGGGGVVFSGWNIRKRSVGPLVSAASLL